MVQENCCAARGGWHGDATAEWVRGGVQKPQLGRRMMVREDRRWVGMLWCTKAALGMDGVRRPLLGGHDGVQKPPLGGCTIVYKNHRLLESPSLARASTQ
jgi:hypothetical protein